MDIPPRNVRFTHTPLNFESREIRLLTIEPSSEPSSPIQITIKHADLSRHIDALTEYREELVRMEAREWVSRERREAVWDEIFRGQFVWDEMFQPTFSYTALSYTWGPELPAQDILVTSPECHGWLSVRQNLYDFLKMRRNGSSAWFWIDQICINQGQDDEKAHQVNQMADIYSAATVEIWLGSGFEGSDDFMDSIALENIRLSQTYDVPIDKRVVLKLAPALQRFVSLPYWSRLWVIQEVILSRAVDIRIGSKTISWNTFFSVLRSLRQACQILGITETLQDLGLDDGEGGTRIWKIELSRSVMTHRWDSVGRLVFGAECSDLRDRVFGAMGMVRPSLRVFPDYSMNSQDILLMLLDKHVGAAYDDNHNDMDTYGPYIQGQQDDIHEEYPEGPTIGDFRRDCIDLAASWLPQLEDDENRISSKSVRSHLLSILPLGPPILDYRFGRKWQFKAYLWYKIPNRRSMRWRLSRAGIVRFAHMLDRIKPKPKYVLAGHDWQFASAYTICD